MNVVKKYWDSVYVYILLLIPIFCICAGMFWTVFKFMGHYPHLKWLPVIIFDCNQIIYLLISLYFIYKTKKNSDYIYKNLKYVKCFMTIVLFVQYNFILHLFASEHVWECTFLFFAGIVFFFDTKFTIINLLSYYFSLLAAHLRNPEAFLPTGTSNFIEIIAFRITILTLTTICIIVIVYFAEHFLMQAKEKDEENLQLLAKQLDYYKDMELLDTEIRKFRHDINNHFLCMEHLFSGGKTDELRNYFEDLQKTSAPRQSIYFSGNEIIDAILHYDVPHRCNENVDVRIYGNLSEIKTVSSMDLCTIFSNLLSNAIKSANQCSEETKSELLIRFSSGEMYFAIEIANTLLAEGLGIRQKKDKNHGFGTNKIKEVLEKYDGKIESIIEKEMITITDYLPL